jgi:hypothetical protein
MAKLGCSTTIRFLRFWGADPWCNFLGAKAPANSRTGRKNVWSRFVRAN